ncbi:MAG TPA: protease pro-enzyme activation domain-containing protein, partial [Acidimicrobiales bacterium]|nr:protease pro-enzyme activation domain-containing protein [Acidimicrobiales bacterium]
MLPPAGRRTLPRLATLIALAVALALTPMALTAAASARASSALLALPDYVPGLATLHNLGATNPSAPIQVELTFQHNTAAINSFERSLYDPRSSSYHRFLSPAQFAARFDAPAAAVSAARRFATAHGMS